MTIEKLEKRVKELEDERKDLLNEISAYEQNEEILKDTICDRDARIFELEKGMEEAIAALQYVL